MLESRESRDSAKPADQTQPQNGQKIIDHYVSKPRLRDRHHNLADRGRCTWICKRGYTVLRLDLDGGRVSRLRLGLRPSSDIVSYLGPRGGELSFHGS